MRFNTEKKHVVDLIFPIALFFVFAATSLIVVLMASNIYSSTTKASKEGFETRTVLSYITEKIHQSDENQSISVSTFDGLDALVIRRQYEDNNSYTTYIYEDNGVLRELFIKDGTDASASDGKELMPVNHFTVEALSDTQFCFSCISEDGNLMETLVSVKSQEEF